MAESRQVEEWNRTALLAVLIANPNRDPKKRPQPFEIRDFHPYMQPAKREPKTAAQLLAGICAWDGIEPSVVTETTWAPAPAQ